MYMNIAYTIHINRVFKIQFYILKITYLYGNVRRLWFSFCSCKNIQISKRIFLNIT